MKRNKIYFIILLFFFISTLFLFPNKVKAGATDDFFSFELEFSNGVDGYYSVEGINMSGPIKINDGVSEKDAFDNSVSRGAVWNLFLERYKGFIVGLMGLLTLILIAFGMVSFVTIASGEENPQKRKDGMNHLLMVFIAAAIFGIGTIIFAYAYNVF